MRAEESARLLLETLPSCMRKIRSEMRGVASGEFTIPQYRVLGKVSRAPMSNGELAAWMGVSAPTMTKMIDKLVRRGHLKREPGADRRQVRVHCTERGARCAREIRGKAQALLAQRISLLSKAQHRELVNGLRVLQELLP